MTGLMDKKPLPN